MSCAAGVTDGKIITLGADSAASGTGDEIYTLENLHKVFARDAYLFGYCGSARIGQILRYQVELPEPPAAGDLEPFLVRELVPEIRRAVEAAGAAGEGHRVLGDKTAILIGCRAELWCVALSARAAQQSIRQRLFVDSEWARISMLWRAKSGTWSDRQALAVDLEER